MRKVVVQYDEVVKFFKNVTKVQCFCGEDFFCARLIIYQGENKTTIKMHEINGFEVVEH